MPPEASVGIQRPGWSAAACLDALDGAANLGGRHVVEEDGLGAVGESFFKLPRGAHLDLHALTGLALLERALEHRRDAAAERDVIVLDENAGGEIDAVIGSPAAEDGVFFKGPHAGDGFARVEHAGAGALNRVSIFTGERGDAAEVLQQVEDHALATEQDARVVADDGEHLASMGAHAVEDFGMADDFKASLRVGRAASFASRRAKISKKRGMAPRPATTSSSRAMMEPSARRTGSMVRLVVASRAAWSSGGPAPAMRRCGGSSNP